MRPLHASIAISVFKLLTQPAMASATQIAALSVVQKHCEHLEMTQLKQQMNEVMLEMERKSMAAEDARSAMMSPHTNVGPGHFLYRFLTWKEWGQSREHHCRRYRDAINNARENLLCARQEALAVLYNNGKTLVRKAKITTKDILHSIVAADRELRNESTFMSGMTSDESESSDEGLGHASSSEQ